jgi:hypothetical protein
MLEENILVLEAYAAHLARFLQQQSKLPPSKQRKAKNWKKKQFKNTVLISK